MPFAAAPQAGEEMKNTPERKKFIAALVLASLFGVDRFGLWTCVGALWNIIRAMTARRKNLDRALGEKRMEHCNQCPLYYSPLSTCSGPLADDPSSGCWCFLPRLSQDPQAECWMDKHTDLNAGWKSAGL